MAWFIICPLFRFGIIFHTKIDSFNLTSIRDVFLQINIGFTDLASCFSEKKSGKQSGNFFQAKIMKVQPIASWKIMLKVTVILPRLKKIASTEKLFGDVEVGERQSEWKNIMQWKNMTSSQAA